MMRIKPFQTAQCMQENKRLNFLFSKKLLLLFIILLSSSQLYAQRVALKSNALYWATLSPNLGAEFRISRHFTVDLEVAGNPFKLSDKLKTSFIGATPEVRYWFEGRPHARHFAGIMGLASGYSLTLNHDQHKGTALGAGLTYGYSFVLGKRWSLETTVGAGVLKVSEKHFKTGEPVPASTNRDKFMFAPLKVGVTFVYIIK